MGKSSYFSDSLYSDFTEVVLDKQRKVQEEAERTRSRLFNLSITNIDDPDSGLLQENLEDNIFTPFRLGQPLSSMDAFEAEKNGFYHPGKLPKHIQAYAEKYSINPTDVTIEMLNAEEVKQKTNFIQLLTEGQGAIVGDKVYRDPNVDIFNPVQEPDSLLTPIVKPEGATAPVELSPGNYKAFDPKVLVTTHGKDMLGRALVELVNPITGVNINRAMNTAENNAYYNSRFNVKGAINYAAKSDALKEVGPFAENNLEVTKNENGTFNIRRNPNDGSGKQYTPFYLSDLTEEEVLVWTRVAIENPEKGLAELYEHDALQSVDRFNNMVLDVTGKALQGVNYFASGTDLEDEYARKWFKDNVQPFGTDYESLRDNVPDFKAVANKYKKLAAKDSSQFTEDEKEFWNSEQGEILHTITSDITAYEDRKQSLKEFETSLQHTIYTTVREYEENATFITTYKEYAYDEDGNALGLEDKAQGAIAGTLEMFANNPESIPSSFFENLPYMLAFAFGGWATKATLISEKDDSLIEEWHTENPGMEMTSSVRNRILLDAAISVIAESLGDKWVLRGKLTALKGKIDKVLPTTNLLTRAGLNTSMKAAQIASSTGFEYASGTISSMAEQDALLQDVSEIDDATAALAGAQEAKAGMGGASIRIVGDVAFKANIQERLNQIQSRNEILADSSRSLTVKQQTRVIESRDKLIASFLKDSDKNLQEKVRAPYLKRAWDSLKSSKNPKDLVLSLISPGNRDKIRKVEYLEHVLNVTEIELVGLGDVFDKEKAEALGRNPTDIDTAVWLLSVLKKLPPSEVNRVLITNLKTGIGYANEVSKTDIHLANAISVPTEEGSLDIQSFETDSKEQAFAINRANAINQYRTDVAKVIDIFGKKIEANPDQEEVLRLRQTDQLYRLKAGLEDTLRDVNLTQEVAQKSRDKIVQIDGIDTTSVDYNPVVEIDNIFNALEQDTVEDVDGRIKVIFAHRSKIDLKRQAAELAEDKTLEATYIKQIELVDKKLITFLESNKSTPAAESKLTPDIQTELFSIGSVDDFNNFKEIREKIGNTELSESEQKMLDIKESISKSLIFDETDKTLVEVHEEFLNGKSNEYIGLNEYLRQAADKSESFIPTRFDAFVERHQVKAEKLQEAAKLVIEGKKETHAFVDKNDLTAPIQTAVEGTEKHKKLNTTQYFRIHPGSNALLDITAKEAKIAVEAKNAMQLIFARQGKQTRRNVATVVSEQLAKDIKKAIKKETKPKDKGDIDSLAKRGKKPVAPKVDKPLIAFHGSGKVPIFANFKFIEAEEIEGDFFGRKNTGGIGLANHGKGIYLTLDESAAQYYQERAAENKGEGHVYTTEVNATESQLIQKGIKLKDHTGVAREAINTIMKALASIEHESGVSLLTIIDRHAELDTAGRYSPERKGYTFEDLTGAELVNILHGRISIRKINTESIRNGKSVEDYLSSLGVRGYKVNAKNWLVIFDPKNVTIKNVSNIEEVDAPQDLLGHNKDNFFKAVGKELTLLDLYERADSNRITIGTLNKSTELNKDNLPVLLKELGIEDAALINYLTESFVEFKAIWKAINPNVSEVNVKRKDGTVGINEQKALSWLYEKNEDGTATISDEVIFNIMISSLSWLNNNGRATSINRDEIIAGFVYGDQWHDITPEDRSNFHKGVPGYTLHGDLGRNIVVGLNIKLKKAPTPKKGETADITFDPTTQTKLEIALGTAGVHMLSLFTGGTQNKALQWKVHEPVYHRSNFNEDRIINLEKYKYKKIRLYRLNDKFIDILEEKQEIFKSNIDALNILTGVQSSYHGLYFTPVDKVQTTIANSFSPISDKQSKLQQKEQGVGWSVKKVEGNAMRITDAGTIRILMGARNIDEVYEINRKGIEASNKAIDENIEHIQEYFELTDAVQDLTNPLLITDSVLNDGNLVIFFEYKIGSTGRNYNMSANLNGMHSKIDRHIMAPVGNTSTVNSEEMRSLFKLAVAQAFGFDIDKFDVRPAIRFFETEIAGSVEIKTAVEILQRINAGEKVNRKSWNDALIAINNSDLGNKMHIIEGLSALSKYETTKSFETDVTLEIDGVTNGYILSKLQLLGSDQIVLKKDLGRGGITFKGEPTYEELLAEVDESGNKVFKDTYQTFGQYIFNMLNISSTNAWYREDAIKKGKKSVIAITRAQFNGLSNLHGHINIKEEITAFARELAKNPFMISNYGAGLGKILDNVAQDVVNAIYAELEEINLKYKDKETRKDAYTQLDKLAISIASILDENSTSLQKELRNSLNAGTILNDTKDTSRFFTNKRLAVFKDKVKSIYRPSFEVSLDTLLGPIVERRNILVKLNEVSSYMFIINYEDGVEALKLEKIAKKKKTGKGSTVVTADERRSVVLSLISTMYPQYKGPWHDEKSFIDVVKKSSSDPSVVKLAVNPESTKSKANQKGVKELSSFLESLGFEPPGVAIIINMIHNMDSVLIGEVSLTYNFLSIFDAGIFALKDAIGGAALYDTKLLEFARKYRMVDIVIADFNRVLQNYIDTSTGSKKEALAKLVARINKDSYDAKLAIKKGESYEFVLSELIQDAKKLQLEVREEAKLLDEDGIVSNQMYLQHNLTPDKGQLEMFFPVGGRKKPFSRLNKKELLEEAANRAIDTTNMRVVDLKEAIKRYDLGKKVYPRLVPPTLPDLNPITPVADYIAGMVHPDSEDAGDFRGMDIHGKRKKGDIAGFYSEDGQGIDRIVLSEISEDLSEFDLSLISDGLNNDYVDIDWIKEQVSIEMSGEFYHPDSVREMHFYDGEQQQYEQDLAQQEAELKVERKAEEKARAELTNFEQLELFNKDAEYQRTSRLETSQENKKLFEAIKQHLAQTYPEVSVKIVDRVIDMFGEEVLGKAVRDTVYYSDTAYMDTVAHEYAHIYINILESTTFVDAILTRIQKENDLDRIDAKEFLTTHLGEKYVEYEKTNTWFTKAKYKLIGKINQLGRWLNKLLGKELKLKQKTALLQWEIDELSKHFYFGINSKTVRFSPSKGFNKVSLEDTLKENPEASEVLIKLLDTYEGSALTGSVALAEQGNVYRRGKGELHDLDMHIPTAIFDNAKTLFEQVSKDAYLMWEFEVVDGKRIITYIVPPEGTRLANVQLHSRFIKFSRRVLNIITGKGWTMLGSRIKSLDVVDIKTGKVVGGYSATIARNDKGFGTHITSEEFTGKKIVIVDLLENFEKVESYSFESAVLGRTIPLVKAYRIFRAKNTMGQARNTPRDKDVIDFTLFKPDEKLGITKPDELESAIDQKIEVEKTQEKETEKDVSKEELYSLGVEKEAIRQEEADFANPNLFEVVEKLNKVFKERSDKDYINDESRDEHSAHLDNILGNLLIKNNTELKEFSIETYESRDEFSVGRVNPVTGTVILDLNKHTPISYSEQTDQEVYVHEVLHVVSEHVISNHPEIANKLRKLYKQAKRYVTVEDFLEKDSDGNVIFRRDEVAERAAAQRQFDYLFKTLDAGKIPHEFLAYGLTNKFLVRKLKTLKYHHFTLDAGKGKDNFLINLVDLLVDTWEFFKDILINQRMPRKSLYDETVQVMRVINAINARKRPGYKKRLIDIAWRSHFKGADFLIKNSIQAIFKLVMWKTQKRDMKELVKSMLKRANLPLELIKDSALRKSVEAATERYYIEIRDNLIKVKNVPKNSKRYKDLRGKQRELTISFREELMTLAQSIGVEILGTTPIQLLDAILQVKFDKDHGRRSEKEEYTVNLMSEFKSLAVIDKLLSENVTIAFFRTDFVSLRENGYDDLDAIEFLVDEEALDIEIAKLEKILDISNNEFYRQKLIGLVDLMVIGDTTVVNAYRNAHNIFNLNYIEKNKNVPSGTKEEASLDVLATLMAIKRTDASVRKSVYELSKAEFAADVNENGILNLLGNLEAFKKDTLKELFNGVKVHVVKGYVGLITDPNRSLLVAPLSEEAKLKSEGFILIVNESGNSALPPITGMPTKFFATHRKVGLYVSSLDPTLANTEGVFSTTSVSHSKGTSVKQILFDENPEFAFQVYKLLEDYTKLQNKQEVYNLKNKSTGTAKSPVPILNHNLEVTDYAINLRHEYSREHLNQNLNFIAVFAQMRSHLLDKKVSKELSKKNIAVLVSDSRKYQVGDTDYVNILDPKYAPSTFERLPDYTKREILKRATRTLKGTNEFWVKKISINVFFGSTPPTASNLKGIRNLPLPKRTIKMIESVWQSTVRQAVVNIVIKIWAVLGGNVTSNAIYNLLRGMSPIFLVREQRNAIKEHDRWQKDAHRLNQIIIKAKAYPKLAAKLEIEAVRLTKGLRQNPVDKFMTSGLFVAYTEDVLENQFKYANRIENFFNRKFPRLLTSLKGSKANTFIQASFITEKSYLYKPLLQALQLSDFVARYALYKHLIENEGVSHADAWEEVVRAFIAYDVPLNPYVKYANDMGFILFVRYWLRIQSVGLRLAKNEPSALAFALVMQDMADIDPADIYESHILLGNILPPEGGIDKILSEVAIPPGWELGAELIP